MNSDIILLLIDAALIGLLWWLWKRRKSMPAIQNLAVRAALRDGDFAQAASEAAQAGDEVTAIDYFLRAKLPERAAALCIKRGDLKRAAEIYEQANLYDKAATQYERAGIPEKVEAMRGLASARSLPRSETAEAHRLDAVFRDSLALGDTSMLGQTRMQGHARDAAEAYIFAGEMRAAAGIYRDAGLNDEAIHLYTNLLGDYVSAAGLIADSGRPEQAADLYEVCGDGERAADVLLTLARAAPRPDAYIERLWRNSPKKATAYFEEYLEQRSVTSDTVPVAYRLAEILLQQGDRARATALFAAVERANPTYRDASVRAKNPSVQRSSQRGGGTMVPPSEPAVAPDQSGRLPMQLEPATVAAVAQQEAEAVSRQVRRLGNLSGEQKAQPARTRRATGLDMPGAKKSPGDTLVDAAVASAKTGPSIEALQKFIADRPADLQNIEVYYRLGIALLARGEWSAAVTALEAVDEASPGYRDGGKRANLVRAWQDTVGGKGSTFPDPKRYQLRGELGRSSRAVVYRATDTVFGRDVALKVYSGMSDSERNNFLRAAESASDLSHPSVTSIFDSGVAAGRAFVASELVDGSLVSTLAIDAGLTMVESLRILQQVINGLDHAHQHNISHGDLKPSNVMRTTTGLAKVIDIGVSLPGDDGRPRAPELTSGTRATVAGDRYALGVMAYELLGGRLPAATAPEPLMSIAPQIPPQLSDVVMECLAAAPEQRPAITLLGRQIRAVLLALDPSLRAAL